jgi:hypothetical protein
MPVSVGDEADAHELIAVELLLAAQAANDLLVGIVSRAGGNIGSWFHVFLLSGTVRGERLQ